MKGYEIGEITVHQIFDDASINLKRSTIYGFELSECQLYTDYKMETYILNYLHETDNAYKRNNWQTARLIAPW